MYQDQGHITLKTTYQTQEATFCQPINLMEEELFYSRIEIVSLMMRPNAQKVHNIFEAAPGPGNYRLPSDFGIYDHRADCKHDSVHGSIQMGSIHGSTTSVQLPNTSNQN
jgi:hypothetical protein